MKSIYKRVLVFGMSLALIALAGLRKLAESQLTADPGDAAPESDGAGGDRPVADRPGRIAPGPIAVPDRAPQPRLGAFSNAAYISATKVTFSGRLVRSGPNFALQEMAGALYTLDSISHPLPPVGEEIRVTGRLDIGGARLHVDDLERFEDVARPLRRASGQ